MVHALSCGYCGALVLRLLVLVRFFFFFSHTFTFQLLDKPWSQDLVSSLPPPGSCLQFLSRIYRVQQSHCSSIFHRVLLTHALARSASQSCAQEQVPTNLYEYALGGANSRYNCLLLAGKGVWDDLLQHASMKIFLV